MNNKCATCKKAYPFKAWIQFRKWCKKCKIYQCELCLDKKFICKKCGNKTANHIIKIIPISLVIIIICIIFLQFNNEWAEINDMEVTDIDDIEVGDTVKVEGYINSSEKIVISTKNVPSGIRGYKTEYIPIDFYLKNGAIEIFIDTSKEDLEIMYGRHSNGEYWNGDRVCVVGKVYLTPNDMKAIKAEMIANDPKDFYEPIVPQEILFIIIFGSIGAIIVSMLILIRRNKIHSKYISEFNL